MSYPKPTMAITSEDVQLLAGMSFDWDGMIECGGIATDFKRPFGSSGDITIDAQRLLGRPPYDPGTGESAMSWDEVTHRMKRLAAVVEELRRRAVADPDSVIGARIQVPWRAAKDWDPE